MPIPRLFADAAALAHHMKMKRRISAAHGMSEGPERFPRSRQMIADAMEEAIFDAFGMEPPESNSRPIRMSQRTT